MRQAGLIVIACLALLFITKACKDNENAWHDARVMDSLRGEAKVDKILAKSIEAAEVKVDKEEEEQAKEDENSRSLYDSN